MNEGVHHLRSWGCFYNRDDVVEVRAKVEACKKPVGCNKPIRTQHTKNDLSVLQRRGYVVLDVELTGDQLYNYHVKIYATGQAPVIDLFETGEDDMTFIDEAFAFERCISRLTEMQSKEYRSVALSQHKKILAEVTKHKKRDGI